ncbi:TetR/AcrR family transcriptional regulator [Nitrospirillum iridis]|uniref:AcrR family transcriptional regulator n=1 Tax=Nitrospirillum iridis TaxID=765888 RepID=A0A7X0ECF9_9PROT|nr:TetR/AcrR family transcriptional regulator [Nitrospirillum iridis]MBB6249961.1 AcrR family transcriptional regulator [Nitrospirillum iridis]
MSSQKSMITEDAQGAASDGAAEGRTPKRARGRLRVAAILDAAVAVFTEKGFDAATMTEVAARSRTAIGSLYRFFPSKDALAEALLRRYSDRATAGLSVIAGHSPRLTPTALADALVDLMQDLAGERSMMKVLMMDRRGDAPEVLRAEDKRGRLRAAIRGHIAHVLSVHAPTLPPERMATVAGMLLHLMKAIPDLAEEGDAVALLSEMRLALGAYLGAVLSVGPSGA